MIRKKKCNVCKNEFEFNCNGEKHYKSRKFCSVKCQHSWLGKILKKTRKGKGNPMYGKTAWNKDMKMSKEHCKRQSESHKGKIGYWKNKKRPKFLDEWKDNISKSLKGRKITWSDKLRKPKTEEHKKNISLSKMGDRNPMWQGGVYEDLSASPEYGRWRQKVLKRDNYTCQKCGDKKSELHIHHKKFKSKFPELIFSIDNGIVLCKLCHNKIHYIKKYGTKK